MQAIKDYIHPIVSVDHKLYREPQNKSFVIHVHNVNEILYFISGDATYMVEGTEYKLLPGSIMFMKHGEAHVLKVRSSVPYERIVIHCFAHLCDSVTQWIDNLSKISCTALCKLFLTLL